MIVINKSNKNKLKSAFTIIELIVVITLIGILVSIIAVSYNNWRQTVVTSQLKSDLTSASTAMDNARVYENIYPPDINDLNSFKPSRGVELSGGSENGEDYCITATSTEFSNLSYYIDSNSEDQSAIEGFCTITLLSVSISGNSSVGSVLSATSIVPSTATVSYQWKSSSTLDGNYENISNATSPTYTVTNNELGKYIKLSITGTGDYSGTVSSGASSVVVDIPIITIGGVITESGGYRTHTFSSNETVSITKSGNVEINILGGGGGGGANGCSYNSPCYGNNGGNGGESNIQYPSGTYYQAYGGTGGTGGDGDCDCGGGDGSPGGTNHPAGFALTNDTIGGGGAGGPGEGSSYSAQGGSGAAGGRLSGYVDVVAGQTIGVTVGAAGTSGYGVSGTGGNGSLTIKYHSPSTPISSISISGTTAVGSILSASSLSPSGATVAYQWLSATTSGGTYTNISGATNSTLSLSSSHAGKYIKLSVMGLGGFTGTATSSASTIVTINTPAAPTVTASTPSTTTTWSWGVISCNSGTSVRYQYRYTISPSGYDSGLVANTTRSVAFTTSTTLQTYTVAAQAQCYTGAVSSSWSNVGSVSYYRPGTGGTITYTSGSGTWTAPAGVTSVTVAVWGGGASGGAWVGVGEAGGGGGAYTFSNISVVPGNSYSYFVGGYDTDSWFVSSSTILAKTGSGISGGAASSCIPSANAESGGNGTEGDDRYTNTSEEWGGDGGSGAHSGGLGGTGGWHDDSGEENATAATVPGGGGGGGSDHTSASFGANGKIVLTW